MDKSIRGLHDQLNLHEPSQTHHNAAWCDGCKTIVARSHSTGNQWVDIFGTKNKDVTRYNDNYLAEVASELTQADKDLIIDDLTTRPELCGKFLRVPGFDQAKLKAALAKSKIALNKAIQRSQMTEQDLSNMKSTILSSARLAYNALRSNWNQFTGDELLVAEATIAKSACYAFQYAYRCGRPSDAMRIGASKNARYAFKYARGIDKGPHDVTRTGASKDAAMSYWYAKLIDKCEHPITLAGAATEPKFAYAYARMICKKDVPVLRAGAAKNDYFKDKYEAVFGAP